MRLRPLAKLVLVLLTLATSATAQEPEAATPASATSVSPAVVEPRGELAMPAEAPAPPPRATDPRRTELALTSRIGMMTTDGSLHDRRIAPAAGVGLDVPASKLFAVSIAYDFAFERRGVDDVWVDRKSQYLVGTLDVRVPIFRVAYLRGGVGFGGALLAATSHAFDDSRTSWKFLPGAAWKLGLTTNVPRTPFDVNLGASGLVRDESHDILFFAGLSYAFEAARPAP